MRQVTYDWVKKHIICEFDHYDICLKGLCVEDDIYYVCTLDDFEAPRAIYTLHQIKMEENSIYYLSDYKKAYPHWFYVDGKRNNDYCKDFQWFKEKWPSDPFLIFD